MIRVYLTYARPIIEDIGGLLHQHPPRIERFLIGCKDEEHAARVVSSWLRDPDTISVRAERE